MSKTTIPTGGITADAINGTLIADDAINSEHYTDGSIDTGHIGDSQVTSAKVSGVGGLVRVGGQSTHTNASAYEIDNIFSNTYTRYKIIGVMMQDNTSSTVFCKLRSWDGSSGANLEGSSYVQATVSSAINASGGTSPVGSSGAAANEWNDSKFSVAVEPYNDRSSNRYGISIDYTLYRPDGSAYVAAPYLVGNVGYWEYNGGTVRYRTYNTTIQYDVTLTNLGGLRFFADSGNMSMIDVSAYGIVGS